MTTIVPRAALLAMLVGASACDGGGASIPDPVGRRSTITADSLGLLAHEAYSGYRSTVRLVVTDAGAWADAWDRVYATVVPRPPRPDVDFAGQAVLVVAAGERLSGGFDIRIDSVVVGPNGTDVHVATLAAGPGCFTTAALTQPVFAAHVSTPAAPVRFVEHAVQTSCD